MEDMRRAISMASNTVAVGGTQEHRHDLRPRACLRGLRARHQRAPASRLRRAHAVARKPDSNFSDCLGCLLRDRPLAGKAACVPVTA